MLLRPRDLPNSKLSERQPAKGTSTIPPPSSSSTLKVFPSSNLVPRIFVKSTHTIGQDRWIHSIAVDKASLSAVLGVVSASSVDVGRVATTTRPLLSQTNVLEPHRARSSVSCLCLALVNGFWRWVDEDGSSIGMYVWRHVGQLACRSSHSLMQAW